ncbi:hypothetical protein H6G11_15440 [Cyanobacterium aponinum FACHB-4101]|nr:hypothetical protein [Cyanobacterium aponinum FACHB-4101]
MRSCGDTSWSRFLLMMGVRLRKLVFIEDLFKRCDQGLEWEGAIGFLKWGGAIALWE